MERNSRRLLQRLLQDGFALVRVSGSHHILVRLRDGRRVVLPHPNKDIPLKTVISIYTQAGWPKD